MASNVPTFASFRPKPKPTPTPLQENQSTSQPGREKSKEHKRSRSSPSPPLAKKYKVEKDIASSKSYFSDRRGDADVLRYGALNRYDIPAYRRFGYGYVLGLDTSQKIDRERSSDAKVYLTPAKRRRQERLLIDKRNAKESDRTLRFIKPGDNHAHAPEEDFIAVSTGKITRNDDSIDEDEEPESTSYRSMVGTLTLEQPADPDTRYDSDTEAINTRSEVTKQNSKLVRKTREFPMDIQAWLDFIDHQEAMISLDLRTAELNDATRLQLSDVRIPIYEEALRKIGPNKDSHLELHKGMLKEAQRSWNEAKLAAKYKEVLTKYPGSTDLWFMYLGFEQSIFTQYRYEACRAAFIRCLVTVQAHVKDVPLETVLHIFIRMTSMIHGAGYQELALAIWQAVLELCLAPPTEDTPSFEDFWDGEAPRIGESGAVGWQSGAAGNVVPATIPLADKKAPNSIFEDFTNRETDAIDKLRYPGRTSDDVGEDDAFHTIFFTDVQEYIKLIPVGTSTMLLLEAFLCFCGLPCMAHVAAPQQAWWKDPFLVRRSSPHPAVPVYLQDESDGSFDQKRRQFAACSLQSYQMTSEFLFGHDFPLDDVRIKADFVRRTLKQVITFAPTSDVILGEYLLALELQHFPSEVVKSAKQLLKSHPGSQRLYHAYGLVELNRGNPTKASQVFGMALSLGKTSTTVSTESLILLHSWVWEALSKGNRVEALWRLVSPSGKQIAGIESSATPDDSAVEVIYKTLSHTCEQGLLGHDYHSAVICTALLALVAYLTSDHNATLALTAHQNLSNYFASHRLTSSPMAELHSQSIARLLQYHIGHAPIVKPALIRAALEPLITTFPDNTILLSLYAANELRFAIDDRVRGIMSQSALQSTEARSVSGWSFAIHFETLRGEIAGSTSHSIRALYKRATHMDASGAHCPAIWSAYLHFELDQLRKEREKINGRTKRKHGKKQGWEVSLDEAHSRVKETFYAGLRRLPWCKDFAMLAFTHARDCFSEGDLWKVYGVMLEKEMRLYVELE